ncbi:CoA transferase [Streptomyces humidus]|uniref:CoA transferase n=1 Tax=Streptomyces humidus TaxID=52259 RepID=A0A918G6J4_9ACTN|nr:CoA transferase [Streptomyces humidus]
MIATGPLEGVKVVELAGIGPGPFAATILADLGADVIRIDRPGPQLLGGGPEDLLTRNRERVEVDLKSRSGVGLALQLIDEADILLEGMRPGVTERLGLGPDTCCARNPRLVYGRMTGWGQTGPLAHAAGHDLTYIAITGVLHGLGQTADRPQFPINLLGDFGGGSTFLVIGVLSALLSARMTGQGQVVDAAIVDGTSYLDLMTAGLRASGRHSPARGRNLLDGGVPYYRLYRTLDDRWVAVGALEPQFFRTLVEQLGVADIVPAQDETERHGEMTSIFEAAFASRTMADWAAHFEGTDACVAPVLTPAEAARHAHLSARDTYIVIDDVTQPAPAPRFSGTPTARPTATSKSSAAQVLGRWTAGSVGP